MEKSQKVKKEKKWKWNGVEAVKLEKPIHTFFNFQIKMIRNPDLGFLRQYAINGNKVPVEIIGYHDNKFGRVAIFHPINMPGVTRAALLHHFDIKVDFSQLFSF